MKLGTKINLVLALVTAVVLTIAFWIIVNIEASATRAQVLNDAETSADIFHGEIERMFKQVYDQQVRLQNTIDELSRIEGVLYVNVTGMDGVHVATTDHALIGAMAKESDFKLIQEIKTKGSTPDVRNDEGAFYELERRIPIHRIYANESSEIINVIEVEVATRSKSAADILQAEKLLRVISAGIEQTARSIIVTREQDLQAIQKITDSVTHLGKTSESDEFGFYHDLIVFDERLNIIANTGHEEDEFADDPEEYKKYREDVVAGKIPEAYYDRIHEEHDVWVRVRPIRVDFGGTESRIIGAKEIHILKSAYTDKIAVLTLRMLGIGIVFTAVLVIVLAIILRREVVGPITKYSQVAQKVAEGDLSQKIEHTTDDEIGRFGDVFNSMVANLRELDRLKSDFISVAAHQLRTPLSGVKWVLKLLLDGDLGAVNDDQRGMLRRGFETNEKMIQLVNDLLNVSRIENGKFGYKIEQNDFNKLLQTLVENASLPAQSRQIEVRLEKHAEIRPFFFDPEKLLIALQNLVDNAVKYTLPGGNVTITTSEQGDYLQIKVKDTGVGIPKAEMPKLFSKFFRAANVIHLQTDGSGLGLFIVKSIIMRHGGQIWVDSEEGKGTTFTVLVPLIAELLPKDEDMMTPKADAPAAEV